MSETPRPSFMQELRDAIAPRTVILIIGVLLLQLGFILSYVGAFHDPTPHQIAVSVVAPGSYGASITKQLNSISGQPLKASAAASEAEAVQALREDKTSAVYVLDVSSTRDTLLVSSGGGAAVQTAVETVMQKALASQHRTLQVKDQIPLQSGDARGLTGFYLVIGWIVGGYLVAALLGVAKGSRPANVHRALLRLLALIPYAIVSGIGGALLVGPILGALQGHFWALAGIGMLIVFGAGATTLAFQVLLGVLGIGLTVLVFVILGNPSAGGAYQTQLLPPFWRAIGGFLPNGAGTDMVRRVVYFSGSGITGELFTLIAYVVGGSAVALIAAHLFSRGQLSSALEEA